LSRTVVWDVDDVLNDLMRAWLENYWIPSHPAQVVRYENLRENPPHTLLGISSGEYFSSLDDFRLSTSYAKQAPNGDILAWLQKYGEACRHVALTATALDAAPASAAWVLRHFGRWIREFAVIPAGRSGEDLPIYDIDKGSWLARLGASAVLVDDSPQNLAAAAAVGATALCWPRPWNSGGTGVAETLQTLTQLVQAGDTP
jgi:hypothetical protein